MTRKTDEPGKVQDSISELEREKERLEKELRTQRRIAFAAGLFQGDVTVRTLLESLGEGVVIIDNFGTIVLINSRAEQIFGYTREEIIGKPLTELLPHRYRQAHDRHIAHYFESPRIRPMGQGMELAGQRKDGSEFPVEIGLSHLETANGALALAFVSDITVRKEAEEALKFRNQELDAFAHTVAHDLKTSLTVLIGHSDLLDQASQELSRKLIRDSVKEICKTGRKINQIIDELLLLSSISKDQVQTRPIDMSEVISEAMERLKGLATAQGAEIELPERFPVALGHAPWVEEIWFNYLSNAIKYGGAPPRITVGGSAGEDGYVEFWVRDNGRGMASEALEGIFDYGKVPRTHTQEGYGLGLSIVKRIAEKLNGQVGVKCAAEAGCTFTFRLPVAEHK